jgi:hypothetical protein
VKVIFGRPQPAGENHDGRTRKRRAHRFRQAVAVVADHGFGGNLHTQVVELGGQVERIGIDALRGEQFGAGRDDFGVH